MVWINYTNSTTLKQNCLRMIALAKRQYLYLIIGSFNQLQSFKSKTVCTGWLVHDMSYYVMVSSHL